MGQNKARKGVHSRPGGGEGGEYRQKPYQFEKGGGGVTPSPTPAPVGGSKSGLGGEWGGSTKF